MTPSKPLLTLKRRQADKPAAKGPARQARAHSGPKGKVHKARPEKKQTIGALPRAVAAQIVHAVEEGHSLSEILDKTLQQEQVDERDVALVKEIVYGTLRHRRLIGETLKPLLAHSIKEQYAVVRALILCGIYQLVFTRMPAHAVVAATVGACEKCHCRSFTALVNAVLRRFLREGGHLMHSADEQIEQSFPDWLYQKIKTSYPEQCTAILQESNAHAPMWLRVESSKISPSDYQKLLSDAGIASEQSSLSPYALRLLEPQSVTALPKFAEGYLSVQDVSAQLCAPLLELKPGLEVLDICAAPGGKSAQILDLAEVSLTCADVDETRLVRLQQNLERLRRSPQVCVCDATSNPLPFEQEFDRILIDAPCSGTGVIRRHPDIKWLRRQKDLGALCASQAKILDNCFAKLKSGGILVYATCSILPEENAEQVKAFLERTPDALPLPFKLNHMQQEAPYYQNLPGMAGGDGFFYARFTKK
ncbi:MAG: 16S rRNA (cytosine(967)-C(5))-methyltransferase RsmB [Succinivibrio sp.]|nr:16S rRNA (cytosine(967)-C(5))-methyltransferase RsmB [Succinivibrio sp.]